MVSRAFPVVYASDVERVAWFWELLVYVYVADLDGIVRRLADADVPILRYPEDMPWGERIATVADPEGNPIALCQQA